ncbi:hypothetical protein [Brevundimonas sp.]
MRTETATISKTITSDRPVDLDDYPVREYIRAMSTELAQMALWDGDPALAQALEAAARLANVPKVVEPVRDSAPRRKRAC